MRQDKKAATNSLIVNFILAGLVILVVYAIFFQRNMFEEANNKMRELFSLPEKDPLPRERSFYQDQKNAIKVTSSVLDYFEKTRSSPKKLCIGVFEPPPESFYDEGYQIHFDSVSGGTRARLMKLYEDDTGTDKKKTTQVAPISGAEYVLQGFSTCIVRGQSQAKSFFDGFVKGNAVNTQYMPLTDTQYGVYPQLVILKEEDSMTISMNPTVQYETLDYDPGSSSYYLILKYNSALCLIPTYGDWGNGCNDPGSNGLTDDDCVDSDHSFTVPAFLQSHPEFRCY